MERLAALRSALEGIQDAYTASGCSTDTPQLYAANSADAISDHAQLRALCVPAPCGKGEETVLDPTQRRTLETQEVRVVWDGLSDALEACSRQLCPWLSLEARFYKLLLYEQGDFFRRHVDSKRAPEHLLTLVVDCGFGPCDGGQVGGLAPPPGSP